MHHGGHGCTEHTARMRSVIHLSNLFPRRAMEAAACKKAAMASHCSTRARIPPWQRRCTRAVRCSCFPVSFLIMRPNRPRLYQPHSPMPSGLTTLGPALCDQEYTSNTSSDGSAVLVVASKALLASAHGTATYITWARAHSNTEINGPPTYYYMQRPACWCGNALPLKMLHERCSAYEHARTRCPSGGPTVTII
jgi:hypothetical protein